MPAEDDKDPTRSPLDAAASARKGNEYPEIDAGVLERCIKGDRDALQSLAKMYLGPVKRFLVRSRLLPGATAADLDDVQQEVFARCVRGIGTFRPSKDSRFATWLFTIVRNVASDWRRRRASRPRRNEQDDDFERLRAAGVSPEEDLQRKRLGKAIAAALAELSDEQRMAFVLYHYEGKSCEQIASICETTVGNVKTRLHRARGHMQAKLKGAQNESKR